MTLEQLQKEAQNLVIQRSQLKDQLEQIEKVLGQLSFTIQVMEANAPKPATDEGVELEVS